MAEANVLVDRPVEDSGDDGTALGDEGDVPRVGHLIGEGGVQVEVGVDHA